MSDDAATAPKPPSLIARTFPDLPTRIGVIVSLLLLLIGFLSLVWTPDQPLAAAIMRGLLTSYVVTIIGIAIGVILGVPLGLIAAFLGGVPARIVDHVTGYIAIVPALAVAALLTTLDSPGPLNAMAAIGIASIPVFAGSTRNATVRLLGRPYVDAARLTGLSPWDAANRHVLPALRPFLVAQVVMQLGFAILAELALGFAGLGAPTGGASLGLMLRDALSAIQFDPLPALVPGVIAALAAGALHLVADGLRRGLDPALTEEARDDGLA